MSYAVSWSGGKDSTLALDRAQRGGLPVRYLFNIYDGASGRVRFHGVRAELISAQAESLGLELVQRSAGPDDFEKTFDSILDELLGLKVQGIIFGNIHLTDVRAWYEERTSAKGFEHVEPLWSAPPEKLVREFVQRGYRALVVSVDLQRGEADWLGREIDDGLIDELLKRDDVDPCGEYGEFHSFAFEGPAFRHPIEVRPGVTRDSEGHLLLDLI